MNNKKVRESNLELLRIILMMAIILHHYIVTSPIINEIYNSIKMNVPMRGGVQLYSTYSWFWR